MPPLPLLLSSPLPLFLMSPLASFADWFGEAVAAVCGYVPLVLVLLYASWYYRRQYRRCHALQSCVAILRRCYLVLRHFLAALIGGDQYDAVLVASIDGDRLQYCMTEIVHDTAVLAASINGDCYGAVLTCGAQNTVQWRSFTIQFLYNGYCYNIVLATCRLDVNYLLAVRVRVIDCSIEVRQICSKSKSIQYGSTVRHVHVQLLSAIWIC